MLLCYCFWRMNISFCYQESVQKPETKRNGRARKSFWQRRKSKKSQPPPVAAKTRFSKRKKVTSSNESNNAPARQRTLGNVSEETEETGNMMYSIKDNTSGDDRGIIHKLAP